MDLNKFLREKYSDTQFLREYHRDSPFYRLADQLILLRRKRGLTQGQLAEKAGTTQTVVSRLENVSVRCSLETVIKLAEALDAVVQVQLLPIEEVGAKPPVVSELSAPPEEEPCPDVFQVFISEKHLEGKPEPARKQVTFGMGNGFWGISPTPLVSVDQANQRKKVRA